MIAAAEAADDDRAWTIPHADGPWICVILCGDLLHTADHQAVKAVFGARLASVIASRTMSYANQGPATENWPTSR